ncbi:MAG TPA: hypothetical protein VKA80_07550 [Beijerinckiaceae bacterium]|nr:hypothetical protein [Beijerinckiaceae bacterium]
MRFAGTIGFVAPGTAHQVALDLRPGEPNRFVLEPPGFALHVWTPETGVVSHVQPIGDFGLPMDLTLDADYPGRARDGRTPRRFVSLKADIVSHAAAMPLVRVAGGRVTTLAGADER